MSKAKNPDVSNAEVRSKIDADIEKFLKSGNKIQQIPTGYSTQDYSKGRKHIVLGNSRQQAENANKQQPQAPQEPDSKQVKPEK